MPQPSLTEPIEWTDYEVEAGTTYFYRVEAFNASGRSAPTKVVSAMTVPTPPRAPSGLRVTRVIETEIDIVWAEPLELPDGNTVTYVPIDPPQQALTLDVAFDARATTITGLTPDTTYQISVVAYNHSGNSAPSNSITQTTNPGQPPAITSFSVTSDVTNSYVCMDIHVEYGPTPTGTTLVIERVWAGATFSRVTGLLPGPRDCSGLERNIDYSYRAYLENASGKSAYTAVVEVRAR